MAQLPMYQQKTRPQAPTASGADFGAGVGQALAQGGDVLAQIGERIQIRNETINGVRAMNQFEQQIRQDFTALQQSEDISDPAVIDKFKSTISERREAALSSFSGRPGSRETLRSKIENMEGQYIKNVMTEQITAQHQIIADASEKLIKSSNGVVAQSPELYDDAIKVGEKDIDGQLSPAMSKQMRDATIYKLRQSNTDIAIKTTIQRGFGDDEHTEKRIKDFENFMNRPDVNELMSMDVRLQAKADISKVRYDRDQKVKNYNKNVKSMQNLGVNITPDISATIPSERLKPLESLDLYQSLTGNKPDDAMIASAFGIQIPKGGSLTATQKDEIYLMNNIDKFSSGQLPQQDAMNFQRVFGKIYGAKTQEDGFGKIYTVGNYVPPALRERYAQGLLAYGYVEPQPGSNTMKNITGSVSAPPTIGPNGKVGYTPSITGMGGVESNKVTGLVPFLMSTVSKVAGAVGVEISPPLLEAYRTKFRVEQMNLVTATQNNNKYPEGERVAISKIIDINPSILGSKEGKIQNLVVMQQDLVEKLYDYRVASETQSVPKEVVESYAEMAPLIKRFVRFVDAGETDVRVGGLYMGDLPYPQVIQKVGMDKETKQKVVMLEDGSVHPITRETNLKDL